MAFLLFKQTSHCLPNLSPRFYTSTSQSANTCWINKYSWPLNKCLNCFGPFIHGFFSNKYVLHYYMIHGYWIPQKPRHRHTHRRQTIVIHKYIPLGLPNPSLFKSHLHSGLHSFFVYLILKHLSIPVLDIWSRTGQDQKTYSSVQSTYPWTKVKHIYSNLSSLSHVCLDPKIQGPNLLTLWPWEHFHLQLQRLLPFTPTPTPFLCNLSPFCSRAGGLCNLHVTSCKTQTRFKWIQTGLGFGCSWKTWSWRQSGTGQ